MYEAIVTEERLMIINYPVKPVVLRYAIAEIKRFRTHRKTLSHAGQGIGLQRSGILSTMGSFREVSMNYGIKIKDLFKAVQSVNADVTFLLKLTKSRRAPKTTTSKVVNNNWIEIKNHRLPQGCFK